MTPQLLIVGHIVKDVMTGGWVPGGGALYAACQAQKLGIDTAVVTACDEDIKPQLILPDIEWHVTRLPACIEFANEYNNGARRQRVRPVNRQIGLEDIPAPFINAPLVLLAPVFHDVDPQLPSQLHCPARFVGLGAQGWLRRATNGIVRPGTIDARPDWLHGSAVFLSTEDVTNPEEAARWQDGVASVLVTRGRNGHTIWQHGTRHDIASIPVRESDPTGAGDIFAVAFLVRYRETNDAVEAARFAGVAAAISVEGSGLDFVASRKVIEARLGATRVHV